MKNKTYLMSIIGCFSAALLVSHTAIAAENVDLSALPDVANNTLSAGTSAVMINAGSEETKSYIRIGGTPSAGLPLQFDVELGVPYGGEKKRIVTADFNELLHDTSVSANVSYHKILDDGMTPEFDAQLSKLCAEYLGMPDYDSGCDVGQLTKEVYKKVRKTADVTDKDLEEWHQSFKKEHERLIRNTTTKAFISGLKSTVGWKELQYKPDTSLAEISSTETSWSVTAYGNYLFNVNKHYWVVGGGTELQEAYKVGESGKLEQQTRKLLFAQLTWADPELVSIPGLNGTIPLGIAPKVTYDVEENSLGLVLPVYLVRDKKGDLSGGVSFGWQSETDEMVVSVFMGKSFTWWN